MPVPLLPEVLAAVRHLNDPDRQAAAVADLAPRLTSELVARTFDLARSIYKPSSRAKALVSLAPRLPDDLLPTALEVARAIYDPGPRAEALIGMVPYVPAAMHAAREGRDRVVLRLVPWLDHADPDDAERVTVSLLAMQRWWP